MITYLVEFHNVPHELTLYVEELAQYGDIVRYSERFPMWVWLDSLWEVDILKSAFGVKEVRAPKYRRQENSVIIRNIDKWSESELNNQ